MKDYLAVLFVTIIVFGFFLSSAAILLYLLIQVAQAFV